MGLSILKIITEELERQHEASRGTGLGCLDMTDPTEALIDGRVDLVALAAAIEDKAEALGDLARHERS